MTPAEIHQRLLDEFGPEVILHFHAAGCDPWIEVAPSEIARVCHFLKQTPDLRFDTLSNLTGVDYLETEPKLQAKFPYTPHIEVVYHLFSLSQRHSLVVKVKLPRWRDDVPGKLPAVPSVTGVWAIADWHEREAYDLMGIEFLGHPNLVRILCAEDWVGHPLRKDYEMPLEYHGIRGR
jgi:NADH-quinone oxidoreductase subunit C